MAIDNSSDDPVQPKVHWLNLRDTAALLEITEAAVQELCAPDNASGLWLKSKLQATPGTPHFERLIDAASLPMDAQRKLAQMIGG